MNNETQSQAIAPAPLKFEMQWKPFQIEKLEVGKDYFVCDNTDWDFVRKNPSLTLTYHFNSLVEAPIYYCESLPLPEQILKKDASKLGI